MPRTTQSPITNFAIHFSTKAMIPNLAIFEANLKVFEPAADHQRVIEVS